MVDILIVKFNFIATGYTLERYSTCEIFYSRVPYILNVVSLTFKLWFEKGS